MSQFAINQEGSFEFPTRQSTSTDLPVLPPSAESEADSHSKVLSQAKLDRLKAEELIASFSDSQPESSFISFADDSDVPPGDFAASDPYVNTQDVVDVDDSLAGAKHGSTEKAVAATAQSFDAVRNESEKKHRLTEEELVSQAKPGAVTNLSAPQSSSLAKVRTVDEILSSIPGYDDEPEVKNDNAFKEQDSPAPTEPTKPNRIPVESSLQATVDAVAELEVNESAVSRDFNDTTTTAQSDVEQASGSLASSEILRHAEGAEVPVSWFSQTPEQQQESDQTAASDAATAESTDVAAASVPSAIVDPVSGEKEFDVRDFSEMADAKIQPIPNAYNDADSSSSEGSDVEEPVAEQEPVANDDEKIHSPLSMGSVEEPDLPSPEVVVNQAAQAPSSEGLAEPIEPVTKDESIQVAVEARDTPQPETSSPEKTKKSIPVTTVMPISQPVSSVVAAASSGLVTPAAPEPAVPNAALNFGSEVTSLEVQPPASSAPASQLVSTERIASLPSELGQLAKTPKPAPAIDDSEIAAAFESCADIPEPVPDFGVPTFSDETFDEPDIPLPQMEEERKLDDTFLVDEGDVITIDGNDGYEFIDLACFDQSVATIQPGRIVIQDEASSTFEVQYKNIQYVLFADGARVDLLPHTG